MPQPTVRRLRLAACLFVSALTAVPAIAQTTDDASANATESEPSSITVAVDEATEKARQQLESGIRFENGEGVGRDYAKALNLYCSAARADYPDALIRLGWLYANGRGVLRNDQIAAALFQRAANQGSDMATQLTALFRSTSSQLPPCLGGEAENTAEAPAPAVSPSAAAALAAKYAPTPQISDPVQISSAPAAIERRKVTQLVLQLARQFKLDPRLVLALIGTESGFDPTARSNRNAQGLMQLIPDTAERFAVKDLFDPMENLKGGMSYLRWLLAYYRGDVVLAVAAYNAGEGAVDRFKGVPPFSETLAYVQKIRAFYPFDFHPFDATAAGPSVIMKVGRDIARENARESSTSTSPGRLPRS